MLISPSLGFPSCSYEIERAIRLTCGRRASRSPIDVLVKLLERSGSKGGGGRRGVEVEREVSSGVALVSCPSFRGCFDIFPLLEEISNWRKRAYSFV